MHDLAILGGRPAFAEPRHVGAPNIGPHELIHARVASALERRILTNGGPLLAEFERRVAELTGVPHCIAVANATLGLQLVAKALGLTGQVVMPSFTFVGTAHALAWIGLEPVFCEVDPRTHGIDPDAAEQAIGPQTTAILGVHLWGRPCDVERLQEVADRNGVALYFDTAHGVCCTHGGVPLGGFGAAEVLSFHATKVAGAGEGGVITTHDPELAARLRLMRNFGFTGYDAVDALGTNAKMSELAAAVGLSALDGLDDFIAANDRNYARYQAGLAGLDEVVLLDHDPDERHNHHYVVTELRLEDAALDRDAIVDVLHAENVLARRYFHPGAHRLAPYRDAPRSLPVTEALCERVLVLPTGTAVSEDDVDRICEIVRFAVEHRDELAARIAAR